MFQTSPLIITMPCFRIPARRYEFFLVMFFATDEINENPYLLPNMSLKIAIVVGMCQDTLKVVDILYSQQYKSNYFINYICEKYEVCYVDLTGPTWKTSLKLAIHSPTPKVRMHDTGGFNNINFHLNMPAY